MKDEKLIAALTAMQPETKELARMRNEFAGMAMQGIVSSMVSGDEYQRLKDVATHCGLSLSQWIARDAVKQADALIAELSK